MKDRMPESGHHPTRREAVLALGSAAALLSGSRAIGRRDPPPPGLKGHLKHSVCQWCYDKMPLDDLCRHARDLGLASVELLGETQWDTVKRYGLTCAMANGPTEIEVGLNHPSEHDRFVRESERLIPMIAERGFPNMIVFSGNRGGLSDYEGIDNCARGLGRILPIAERHGVTVQMELLNSKVDHIDYQCDRTPWGVELAKRVNHPRFKLLYDIYHMQIMEGDVIRTIRTYAPFIGHFHTGGVPGRNEIDETQELNYRRVMQAIVELGYRDYVAQEFIPRRDPMTSLGEGVRICDV